MSDNPPYRTGIPKMRDLAQDIVTLNAKYQTVNAAWMTSEQLACVAALVVAAAQFLECVAHPRPGV